MSNTHSGIHHNAGGKRDMDVINESSLFESADKVKNVLLDVKLKYHENCLLKACDVMSLLI